MNPKPYGKFRTQRRHAGRCKVMSITLINVPDRRLLWRLLSLIMLKNLHNKMTLKTPEKQGSKKVTYCHLLKSDLQIFEDVSIKTGTTFFFQKVVPDTSEQNQEKC